MTRLWDGILDDIKENLVTVTQYDDGRPTSMHKSCSGSLAWRTCHDKLLERGFQRIEALVLDNNFLRISKISSKPCSTWSYLLSLYITET